MPPRGLEGSKPKERSITIDALKGFAIILVVIGHAIQYGSHDVFDFFGHPLFQIIYSFHMPLFILLSGYVAYFSIGNKSNKSIVTSRINTLLIPFLCWGVVEFLVGAILMDNSLIKLPKYIVALIIFPDRGLWFIWVLLILYILLLLIRKFEHKLRVGSYLVIYGVILLIPVNKYFDLYMIKWLMPFFLAGYLISKYKSNMQRALPYIKIASLIVFPVLMLFWEQKDYIYVSKMTLSSGIASTIADYAYRYTVAAAGIALAFTLISFIKARNINKWLAYVGMYSLDIYAIHLIAAHYLGDFPTLASNSYLFNAVYVPAVSIILLALSILLSKFVIKRNMTLSRLLLGSKVRLRQEPKENLSHAGTR
nr:acyltransferase [Cohnella abietis]